MKNLADAFGTIACRGYCTLGVLGAAECRLGSGCEQGRSDETAYPGGIDDFANED